jgi:hypothetical protein
MYPSAKLMDMVWDAAFMLGITLRDRRVRWFGGALEHHSLSSVAGARSTMALPSNSTAA